MRALGWLIATIALAVAVEGVARISGVTDFPLYENSPALGYIPAPGQQGKFLNVNDWAFNERSMGVSQRFAPTGRTDIVLLGDSIVYGGNPLRQADKVGPALERATGLDVWPVAAGSWGLANQLAYLKANPDVRAAADVLVFVLNRGDFDGASVWASELTHPTQRPTVALLYTAERYAAPRLGLELVDQKPPAPVDWREDWHRLTAGKRVIVVRYPDRGEPAFDWPAMPGAEIIDLAADPAWKPAHYRDDIHTNAAGSRALAEIIARAIG